MACLSARDKTLKASEQVDIIGDVWCVWRYEVCRLPSGRCEYPGGACSGSEKPPGSGSCNVCPTESSKQAAAGPAVAIGESGFIFLFAGPL